jgi:transcriptional regulator with XRE-family HTH domain
MTPGRMLLEIRCEHGWTQLQAAVRAGIHPARWSELERDVCSPTFDTIQRIANSLGMEFYYELRSSTVRPNPGRT